MKINKVRLMLFHLIYIRKFTYIRHIPSQIIFWIRTFNFKLAPTTHKNTKLKQIIKDIPCHKQQLVPASELIQNRIFICFGGNTLHELRLKITSCIMEWHHSSHYTNMDIAIRYLILPGIVITQHNYFETSKFHILLSKLHCYESQKVEQQQPKTLKYPTFVRFMYIWKDAEN